MKGIALPYLHLKNISIYASIRLFHKYLWYFRHVKSRLNAIGTQFHLLCMRSVIVVHDDDDEVTNNSNKKK